MKPIAFALLLLAGAPAALAQPAPPAPPASSFAFEEVATLGPAQVVGETPNGRRQSVALTGGTVSGPGISGRILPGGGDYQSIRSDGAVIIDADYMIQTDDGVIIHVRNVGVVVPPTQGRPAYAWAAPKFEAPNGRYGWLNDAIFVSRISGVGDPSHPGFRLTVWKIG